MKATKGDRLENLILKAIAFLVLVIISARAFAFEQEGTPEPVGDYYIVDANNLNFEVELQVVKYLPDHFVIKIYDGNRYLMEIEPRVRITGLKSLAIREWYASEDLINEIVSSLEEITANIGGRVALKKVERFQRHIFFPQGKKGQVGLMEFLERDKFLLSADLYLEGKRQDYYRKIENLEKIIEEPNNQKKEEN